jgi:hypothetical protein
MVNGGCPLLNLNADRQLHNPQRIFTIHYLPFTIHFFFAPLTKATTSARNRGESGSEGSL